MSDIPSYTQVLLPFLGTLFGASIPTGLGIILYRHQRKLDQSHELTMKRRELYSQFLGSVVDAAKDNPEPHLRARVEAPLLASDRVIRALAKYNDYAEKTSPGGQIPREPKQFKKLLAEVVVAMREDVFEKSEISPEEFSTLLPINA